MRFIFSLALGLIMLLCSSAAFSGGSGDIPVIRVNDSNIQLDISGSIQVNRTSPKAQWPWEVSGAWDSYSVEPVKWVGNDSSRVRWFRFRVENRSGDSASMVLSVSNIFIKKVKLMSNELIIKVDINNTNGYKIDNIYLYGANVTVDWGDESPTSYAHSQGNLCCKR